MADKDTPIYDRTRMRGTTWVDATRILFNMGSELEEQVDGMDYEGVEQDLADEMNDRQNADAQLGNRITAEQTAREQADSQLQNGIDQNKSDITQIKETINQIEDNATALGATVAVIQSDVAENTGNIQSNSGRITVLENEYDGFNSEQISLRSDLAEAQSDIDGIKSSMVSDVVTKGGSVTGTIVVEIEKEDGTKISAQDFNYGKPTSIELLQGSSGGMMKAQFTLSDGTTINSNDFQVLEQVTGDVYITSFTFANGSSQGRITAIIGLSDGRTLNANDFQLPTDPQIQSNVTSLLSRMSAVETKDDQQDSSISALQTRMTTAEGNISANDTDIASLKSADETIKGDMTSLDERVTAIEDTPGVGRFELGRLGTIMGSSDNGKISANPDGTGSVNGWDSVATVDDLAKIQSDIQGTSVRLTEIQSDLQEQITNIKPTVTVNDTADPPTISVAVNGRISTADLPSSGGEDWEELNLSSLPTDFSVTDRVEITLKSIRPVSSFDDWDVAPSLRPSPIIEDKSFYRVEITPRNTTSAVMTTLAGIEMLSRFGPIALIGIEPYNVIQWNGTASSYSLFRIVIQAFTGAGVTGSEIPVKRSNITTYVTRMRRIKDYFA